LALITPMPGISSAGAVSAIFIEPSSSQPYEEGGMESDAVDLLMANVGRRKAASFGRFGWVKSARARPPFLEPGFADVRRGDSVMSFLGAIENRSLLTIWKDIANA
jgi:hypothetical protein